MLHTATIYPATLAILRDVMQSPTLQQFNLVGGTALALQIGHRISIDLDLFTNYDYDNNQILQALNPMGHLEIIVNQPPFLQVFLDSVKLDFLKFPYSIVDDYKEVEGIRLVSTGTISVMKLLAIARRGAKKDFIDLYFLLERFSMKEIVGFFEAKIPNIDMFHIFKSLTYFEDAEQEANPKMLVNVDWKTVKEVIKRKVFEYLNSLK